MNSTALQRELELADIDLSVKQYLLRCLIPAGIFSLNVALLIFFALKGSGVQWIALPLFLLFFAIFMFLCTLLPKARAKQIERAIEADIFIPSRMLVTLLESGNSLASAFDRVSKTKTVSGQYFAKISVEIYLGKSLDNAITDAIRKTPSRSFRRVLEPLKNSIRTGASIEKNLVATLDDLTQEKIVEIERYEKRLAPVSMFYMIFGTIMPAIGVIVLSILLSVVGIEVTFFPFLFILLIVIAFLQMFFWHLFKSIRPLVKL